MEDEELKDGMLAGSDDYPETEEPALGGLSGLGMPGADAALAMLIKSNEQARAALQQAREKIAARKYNKAIPLLAISGALGQPTRSGSSAEGWSNAANALIGPLRERDQFQAGQDKELLGIDTQLSGLDQNTATAQLQLAQLRARLQNDLAKAPNDIVVRGGKNIYATRQDARGEEAYVTPGASTTVNLPSTAKSFYETWGEKRAAASDLLYESAQAAPESIARAMQVKEALKKGVITGTAAEAKLALGKLAKAFGWDDADDWIANTETMASQLAKGTLDLIGPSKLGGGTGFSNADRDFLDKVSGNKISLDGTTIGRLMDLHIKAQRGTVKRWNDTYDRLDKKQLEHMGVIKIALPEQGEVAEATDKTEPAPTGAVAPAASAAQGRVPADWAVDPANPPPRMPQREKYLREHPETAQDFLDAYQYLPPDFL